VAIEKGFYSLTELLLDGGCDPMANGNALYDAVVRDEPEIAKLLLERGVPVDSVDMSAVFEAGRAMLEIFMAKGPILVPTPRITKRFVPKCIRFCSY
jgi:hypothetical protein